MKNSIDKIKVIIADDYPEYIEALEFILSNSNKYLVIDKCYNGLELVESSQLHRAEVLLVDIKMPKLNGLEAAIRIKKDLPHIPMIAVTMEIEQLYLKDIINAGFNGYVYKPEASENLLNVIEDVMNQNFVFQT